MPSRALRLLGLASLMAVSMALAAQAPHPPSPSRWSTCWTGTGKR